MLPDNQELKPGDTVEILLPEITKGTTGTVMRACSNDCVVVAIDRKPTMQMRINVSKFLVRKARPYVEIAQEEPEQKPAVIVQHSAYGVSFIMSNNLDVPEVEIDWEEKTLRVNDAYPSIQPESIEDFVATLRTAAQMFIERTTDDRQISRD